MLTTAPSSTPVSQTDDENSVLSLLEDYAAPDMEMCSTSTSVKPMSACDFDFGLDLTVVKKDADFPTKILHHFRLSLRVHAHDLLILQAYFERHPNRGHPMEFALDPKSVSSVRHWKHVPAIIKRTRALILFGLLPWLLSVVDVLFLCSFRRRVNIIVGDHLRTFLEPLSETTNIQSLPHAISFDYDRHDDSVRVYFSRCGRYVLKAEADHDRATHESEIYERLLGISGIPKFFGIFKLVASGETCILLQHCGEHVDGLDGLIAEHRKNSRA